MVLIICKINGFISFNCAVAEEWFVMFLQYQTVTVDCRLIQIVKDNDFWKLINMGFFKEKIKVLIRKL